MGFSFQFMKVIINGTVLRPTLYWGQLTSHLACLRDNNNTAVFVLSD